MKTFKQHLYEDNYGSLVDKETHDRLDSANKALYKYTADGFTDLGHVIEKLQKRYPYDGGTLYRGLHFDSQEQHDKFLEAVEKGELKFNGTSSWSKELGVAEDYGTTKKSFFPSMALMHADRDMRDRGDHMTGYGGVILKTKVAKGVGCDVTKSEFSRGEAEVILPAGEYDVSVEKLIEPHKRKYDTKEKVQDILKQVKKAKGRDDKLTKLVDYVYRSWFDKLEPEEMDIIAEYSAHKFLTLPENELKELCIRFDNRSDYFNKDRYRLELDVHIPLDQKIYNACSQKMQKKFDKRVQIVVARMAEVVAQLVPSKGDSAEEMKKKEEMFNKINEFRFDGVAELREFGGEKAVKAIAPLKNALGKRYHELNSREVSKSLQTLDDIDKHGKAIQSVLQAILKV
jgi:hypothetical protein